MRKVKNKQQNTEMTNYDSDETFYYIAGYTDGGAPFGVTWEEMEKEATGEITGSRD